MGKKKNPRHDKIQCWITVEKKNAMAPVSEGNWISECAWKLQKSNLEMWNI